MHPRRPEWGSGLVHQAMAVPQSGPAAQRLVIEFANQGRVTINTAVAPLLPAQEGAITMSATQSRPTFPTPGATPKPSNGGGWLDRLEGNGVGKEELWRMPASFTDPFATLSSRLAAVLDSFRYGTDPRHPRNLLDWAVAQTGLNDPLSKYTRTELEQAFPRFVRDRDNYFFDMVRTIRRQNRQDLLQQARQGRLDPAAIKALDRATRG